MAAGLYETPVLGHAAAFDPAYVRLIVAGPGNEDERLAILQQHEKNVERQVADLQDALAVIHSAGSPTPVIAQPRGA